MSVDSALMASLSAHLLGVDLDVSTKLMSHVLEFKKLHS